MRKLCRIAEQVEQDLFDLVLVGIGRWKIISDRLGQAHRRPYQWLGSRKADLDQRFHFKFAGHHIDTPRFNLGQIENRID